MPVEYLVNGNQRTNMGGAPLFPSRKVYTDGARTLTAEDNGAYCFFNAAAGFTYTLPTPAQGLWFEFQVTTTATSAAHKILTPASTFLLGGFVQSTDSTYVTAHHAANGSTHRAWSGNGSTTGGILGDFIRVIGINSTQYAIWGFGSATGTEATPFSTS